MTYRFPIRVGDRVAIAPHHDLWMAGCRFGTVTSVGGADSMAGRFYFIDLDTGRNVTLNEADLLGAVGDTPGATPSTEPDLTRAVTVLEALARGLTLVMDEIDPVTTEQAAVMHGATPSTEPVVEGVLVATITDAPGVGDDDGYVLTLPDGRHVTITGQECVDMAAIIDDAFARWQCPHHDCGYGECSYLQPVNGMCGVHGNGEGRCQRDPDPMDSYYPGTGESMGDDSYIDYLNGS